MIARWNKAAPATRRASTPMNIRRGFNRLSIAMYAVWLLALIIGGLTEAYRQRDYYSRELREYEDISPEQRRADLLAFRVRLTEKTPGWTNEQRENLVATVDTILSGQSKPDEDDWFDSTVRPNFADIFGEDWNPKYLTGKKVAEYRKWRSYPFLTFLGEVFTSKGDWIGWIMLFGVPGGLYLSILGLAYGSRWIYRGFASPKPVAVESGAMPTANPTPSDKAAEPHPAERTAPAQTAGTMSKRVLWFVVVTVLWTLGAAWLASSFSWARGSGTGAAWWLWLVLAILWRLVIEFVPVPKKEQPAQRPGNARGD